MAFGFLWGWLLHAPHCGSFSCGGLFGQWLLHISLVGTTEVMYPWKGGSPSEMQNVGGTEQGTPCLVAVALLKTLITLAAKYLPLMIAKCSYLYTSKLKQWKVYEM